jgi:hypothetical protein
MDIIPGTSDDGVQMAAKKPTPLPPCSWLRSQTSSAACGHNRTNTPHGKRALTTAKDLSKPPASILEILQSKPPTPGKGSKAPFLHPRQYQQHHLIPLPQLPHDPHPQMNQSFPPPSLQSLLLHWGSPQPSGSIKMTFSLSFAPPQVQPSFWIPRLDN